MNSALESMAAKTEISQQGDADNTDSGKQAIFSIKQFECASIQLNP